MNFAGTYFCAQHFEMDGPMTENTLLDRAIVMATQAHSGQVDKAGEPYILHPLRLMASMTTEAERVSALLHDVAEDCEGWDVGRITDDFGTIVGAAVDALTKRAGEDYDAYLTRIEGNPIATKVKLADLTDNSDMSRLRHTTEKDKERLRKYQLAISRLMKAD